MAQYFNSGTFIGGQSFVANVPGAGATIPVVEMLASPTNQPIISEVGFMLAATAAVISGNLALGIAPNQGVGQYNISPNSGSYDGSSGGSILQFATAWRILPTVPTKFVRRVTVSTGEFLPISIRFPRGLKIAPSTSLVLYVLGTANRGYWGEYWVEFDE